MKNKVSATQLAIRLIPKILKASKKKSFSFEEIFNMLIKKQPDIFLDDIGDPRYGILRGIVSRYQHGTLFLKNIIITKNKDGMLIFKYSDNDLLKKEATYKFYVNTVNYHNFILENQLKFEDYIELNDNNQDFIKLIVEFNKSINSFLFPDNIEEE